MPAIGLRMNIVSPKNERTTDIEDWTFAPTRPIRTSSMYGRIGTAKVERNVSVLSLIPTLWHMNDSAAIMVSSGITGGPKRVLWSHRAPVANVTGLVKAASLDETSRVFQFTSHNFDVCTIEMLATLAKGGCLCISSESERLDKLAHTINCFSSNFACLTPSTAKLLRPEDVPCLNTVVFTGENFVQDEGSRWKGKCRILIGTGLASALQQPSALLIVIRGVAE